MSQSSPSPITDCTVLQTMFLIVRPLSSSDGLKFFDDRLGAVDQREGEPAVPLAGDSLLDNSIQQRQQREQAMVGVMPVPSGCRSVGWSKSLDDQTDRETSGTSFHQCPLEQFLVGALQHGRGLQQRRCGVYRVLRATLIRDWEVFCAILTISAKRWRSPRCRRRSASHARSFSTSADQGGHWLSQ